MTCKYRSFSGEFKPNIIQRTMNYRQFITLFVISLLIGGCGVVPRSSYNAGNTNSSGSSSPPVAMSVSSVESAKASLMQAYRDWKGTPYVLGGSSKSGVDCSRLVNSVFDNYFGIELPTNTRDQLNVGTGVRRISLRTGDLVFFRTGRRTLHVGILVEGDEFLHASTSSGVMLSDLNSSYWANRYLAARRVL